MLMLATILTTIGEKLKVMSAQVFQMPTIPREANNNFPLLSMFMVRRHGGLKVITNLAQLTPQELVSALVQDAVWTEREQAATRMIAE